MLASDLTLDKADGTDQIFRLVSTDQSGSRRIDIASTLSLPSTLTIKHSSSGKSPNIVDRHLVQVNKTIASAVGSVVVNANFTLTVPRDVAVTSTEVQDVISTLLDFLTDSTLTGYPSHANVDAILRGES
ncbi:coat protein [ssRNA phage Zoerhiza.1_19]|uniref:Coat protein n=2 Tax=Leviviricetes TaxID=2842243 RepID=A0A8S5KYC5_9VIRU|nr:coat protein [ssRNA phage Zoerhiza.1_19]QDH86898.1 MAG: hypothetical protein H1Rhizo25914_000002 [Leviviridae sp.]DAD50127.1 TPA_asm: coat protein [ssRNA phage Zoerhiza.1_19]